MDKIKILIVEDQKGISDYFSSLLKNYNKFDIIGIASNCPETLEISKKINPDIILMDISLPKTNGLDAIKMVNKASPESKIIILSSYEDEIYLFELMRLGAKGFIVKDAKQEDFIKAIEAVNRNENYYDTGIFKKRYESYVNMKNKKVEK